MANDINLLDRAVPSKTKAERYQPGCGLGSEDAFGQKDGEIATLTSHAGAKPRFAQAARDHAQGKPTAGVDAARVSGIGGG